MRAWFDTERFLMACDIPVEARNIMLTYFVRRGLSLTEGRARWIPLHFLVVKKTVNFRLKNEIILISPRGKALSLLKSQFAKKPKNPV
jgi:hypothetical protein